MKPPEERPETEVCDGSALYAGSGAACGRGEARDSAAAGTTVLVRGSACSRGCDMDGLLGSVLGLRHAVPGRLQAFSVQPIRAAEIVPQIAGLVACFNQLVRKKMDGVVGRMEVWPRVLQCSTIA